MGLFVGVCKAHTVEDLKYTPNGSAVLKFSFAQKSGYGENAEFSWYAASIWGKTAENLAGKIVKGTRCFIAGTQKTRMYDKRDGTKGVVVEVNVFHFEFAGEAPAQPEKPANQDEESNEF